MSQIAATASAETITIGDVTYYDVQWGVVTPASVSIIHSRGIETIPLEKLPADLQQRFHYDPAQATAFRAQEESRESARLMQIAAEEKRRQAEADRLRMLARQREQLQAEWVRQTTVLVEGRRVETNRLVVLTGFLIKTGEPFLENGKQQKGVLLELAKPKGTLPDNPLYQLRPGLWESAGEFVFLKRYNTDLEQGMLLRVRALPDGDVRGLRAFTTIDTAAGEAHGSVELGRQP